MPGTHWEALSRTVPLRVTRGRLLTGALLLAVGGG